MHATSCVTTSFCRSTVFLALGNLAAVLQKSQFRSRHDCISRSSFYVVAVFF